MPNRNMRKLYTEEQVLDFIKKYSTCLYVHGLGGTSGPTYIITNESESYVGLSMNLALAKGKQSNGAHFQRTIGYQGHEYVIIDDYYQGDTYYYRIATPNGVELISLNDSVLVTADTVTKL